MIGNLVRNLAGNRRRRIIVREDVVVNSVALGGILLRVVLVDSRIGAIQLVSPELRLSIELVLWILHLMRELMGQSEWRLVR